MKNEPQPFPIEYIEHSIHIIRGQKVMLDADLAILYGIETKALKRAVKRNMERFPEDFMFKLTYDEFEFLRYQIGTSSLVSRKVVKDKTKKLRSQNATLKDHGGSRYLPYAFTEQGVAMLSSVLRSPQAIAINIGTPLHPSKRGEL